MNIITAPIVLAKEAEKTISAFVQAYEALIKRPLLHQHFTSRLPISSGSAWAVAGGLLAYDFHITPDGPKLIEINTNAGGLAAYWVQANKWPERKKILANMFTQEWIKTPEITAIAIVDEAPETQFLFDEMQAYASLLRETFNVDVKICDPQQLYQRGDILYYAEHKVSHIYNRLTDFYLQQPAQQLIQQAWQKGAVVLSPDPRAYAFYADKENLISLSDQSMLTAMAPDLAPTLTSVAISTCHIAAYEAEALWQNRNQYFFKPRHGYSSKGAYRGAKLTRKTFDAIKQKNYLVQDYVAPNRTTLGDTSFKYDIRAYAYGGQILEMIARVYRGQTTNMRTDGAGFAPLVIAS